MDRTSGRSTLCVQHRLHPALWRRHGPTRRDAKGDGRPRLPCAWSVKSERFWSDFRAGKDVCVWNKKHTLLIGQLVLLAAFACVYLFACGFNTHVGMVRFRCRSCTCRSTTCSKTLLWAWATPSVVCSAGGMSYQEPWLLTPRFSPCP